MLYLCLLYTSFPSADRLSFIKTTGANTFEKSSDSVNRLIKNGIKPILNVIDSNRDGLKDLGQMFPKAKINAMPSFNRAGSLKKGGENGKLNNVLKGCSILIQSANINIDGEVFMCSNDFHHKSVYGNIKENSFENIFKSKDFQDKIKQVDVYKRQSLFCAVGMVLI